MRARIVSSLAFDKEIVYQKRRLKYLINEIFTPNWDIERKFECESYAYLFLTGFIDNKSPPYLTHMPWLSIKTSYRVWLSVVAIWKPVPFEILPLNSFVEIEISQNLGEEQPSLSLLFFFILLAVLLILEVRLQRVVPRFYSSKLLQAPRGHYVELNFTMESSYLTPCIDDEYIEVRDGYNESANLLGVFCGRNISVIVRSSGQNLWIRKSDHFDYFGWFRGSYTNKTLNVTGIVLWNY